MSTDHGLKVGDKIKAPDGVLCDVLEVEGRFALVKDARSSPVFPIVCDDGVWCATTGGLSWTVLKPRWRADVRGSMTVVYDGDREDSDYALAFWPDVIDLTLCEIAEVVEAIVDLLNERFPA